MLGCSACLSWATAQSEEWEGTGGKPAVYDLGRDCGEGADVECPSSEMPGTRNALDFGLFLDLGISAYT